MGRRRREQRPGPEEGVDGLDVDGDGDGLAVHPAPYPVVVLHPPYGRGGKQVYIRCLVHGAECPWGFGLTSRGRWSLCGLSS